MQKAFLMFMNGAHSNTHIFARTVINLDTSAVKVKTSTARFISANMSTLTHIPILEHAKCRSL